jgi:hypothetical protein
VSAAFTREDMVDAIATAITDSMDVDWNSHTGAEAVVSNCGVFDLYEALDLAEEIMSAARIELNRLRKAAKLPEREPGALNVAVYKAHVALARARGEQVPA